MTREKHITRRWYWDWRIILGEFVSTSLLISFGCLTCLSLDGVHENSSLYSPIGFGMIVVFLIQAFGHISGAFMNPVISLAAVICGKISTSLCIAISVAQCAGSTFGYGILVILSPINVLSRGTCVTQPHPGHTIFQSIFVEIFFTAVLALITCSMWDPVNKEKTETMSIKFGLAIIGLALASGPVGGMSMNPARSLGPAIWTGIWRSQWLYWIGPCIGAVVGTLFYKHIWMKVDETEKSKEPVVLALTLEEKGENCI